MLTTSEIEKGCRYFEQCRTGIIGATRGITPAQWTFQPDGKWSIGQIVEHMGVVEELVLGPISQALAAAPEGSNPDAEHVDWIVLYQFQDRTGGRFPAPEIIHPQAVPEIAPALARVRRNYDALLARLQTEGLRKRCIESRPLIAVTEGKYRLMDGYQFLLTAGAQDARHTLQILEIKARPDFPEA